MDKTNKLLKSLASRPEIKTPIATDIFLPNLSGDHSAGIVRTTPTDNLDIANKKYVDDAITAIPKGNLTATSPIALSATRQVIGGAAVISIPDANADGATKGAAAFTSANFNSVAGVIDTKQNINTLATPTFAGLTISGFTTNCILFVGAGGALAQDPSNFFWDNTNNRLGIGLGDPSCNFQIHTGAATTDVRLVLTDDTTGRFAGSGLTLIKASDESGYLWNYYNSALHFGTNNLERMTILASGEIGIGAAAPAAKLDVVTGVADGLKLHEDTGARNPALYYWIRWDSSVWGPTAGGIRTGGSWAWDTQLYSDQELSFKAGGFSGASPHMVILTGGNVGIGTTNPSTNFQIGDGTLTRTLFINSGGGGTEGFLNFNFASVHSSGNDAILRIDNTYTGTTSNYGSIQFRTKNGAQEGIFIHRDGNVSIGTIAPTSKLQVVGLPVYANNAAAVAGGLTAGAFYRTNADPDPVCVVH